MKDLQSLTGTSSTEMQTGVFDSNEAGILQQHLCADSHEVKAAVLAHITKVLCLADKTLTTYWPAVVCLPLHHLLACKWWPAKGFILALCSQLNLAEQEKFLRLLQHTHMPHTSAPSLVRNLSMQTAGFGTTKKGKQDRIDLSELSSLHCIRVGLRSVG